MDADRRLVVGLVRGAHGLRGAVRVEPLTDRPAERFAAGRTLFREASGEPLTIVECDPDAAGLRVRFAEVADRTAAESLLGVYLEADVGPAEALPRGEYYWHEVIGSHVTDTDGVVLGDVVDVYRAGGGEVLLVRGPRGELDIPVVRAVIRIFAPRRREIVVDRQALGLDDDRSDLRAGEDGPDAAPDEGRTGTGPAAEA